ncbi:MAG: hypothetical protein HYV07_12330 [Deltaproteobacteria bacterium]|nr:hypothetical protein [Deltaproteobacteria bacterium]
MSRFAVVAALLSSSSIASAATLWDQLDTPDGSARASQEFETANSAFDIAALDDFTLTSASTLTGVEFNLQYFNGVGVVDFWRVEIYSSPTAAAANLIGDVAHFAGLPGGQPNGTVALAIPATTLPAGTYYIAFIGVMSFAVGGQVGIGSRPVMGGTSWSAQANPNGGFGFPGGLMVNDGIDLMFRIFGDLAVNGFALAVGPGSPALFEVTGAPAGQTIHVLASVKGTTGGPCSPQGFPCTDLVSPVRLFSGMADGAGNLSVNANPYVRPGKTTYYQAMWYDATAPVGDKTALVTQP